MPTRRSNRWRNEIPVLESRLRSEGAGEAGEPLSMAQVRDFKEQQQARLAIMKLRQSNGEMVNRIRALDKAFSVGREARDRLLELPARISAIIASEVGADAYQMEQALSVEVRAKAKAFSEESLLET